MQSNGFINASLDMLTNLEIFRSKPAAHVVGLQVGIQPLGKGLVFSQIANEAGVELNGLWGEGSERIQ